MRALSKGVCRFPPDVAATEEGGDRGTPKPLPGEEALPDSLRTRLSLL